MALPLTLEAVMVTGENGRQILSAAKLSIAPGEAVGVRGPSGAGKSTLLFALAGLVPATGRIRWGDTDIAGLSPAAAARFRGQHIGMIFQDFLLFEELSPLANAALAEAYAPRAARGALRPAASRMLTRLGLDPATTRTADSFSGGERQRIAIARALAHDPAVILADEPTASLDRAAADALIGDLAALARDAGKTLIAVSHDAALHDRMDRVIDIRDGVVRADA